ncbi:hypothetical protein, partial [Caballeronia choica]|uniref:hypothetical protein n=1 Tax=Caballeronia choica TaxID=326476 RepID=UPI001F3C0DC9
DTSFLTVSGVAATRASFARVSAGTPILMNAPGINTLLNLLNQWLVGAQPGLRACSHQNL